MALEKGIWGREPRGTNLRFIAGSSHSGSYAGSSQGISENTGNRENTTGLGGPIYKHKENYVDLLVLQYTSPL